MGTVTAFIPRAVLLPPGPHCRGHNVILWKRVLCGMTLPDGEDSGASRKKVKKQIQAFLAVQ